MEKTITFRLTCSNFPGIEFENRQPVYVGVQKKSDIVDERPGDAKQAVFSIPARIKKAKDGRPDFLGPYIHGKVGDRFIYLVWFENKETKEPFRRAKIKLSHLTWAHLQQDNLEAHLMMTDQKGCPVCATVPESLIRWNTPPNKLTNKG
jgi:hypothetical protein